MELKQIIEACQYRICGGTEHMWDCYGPDARYLDFSDQDGTETVSCVFDSKSQHVYQVDMHVPGYDQGFVWRDPAYEALYQAECERRGIKPNHAWDDVYYDVVDEATALSRARDIIGTYYDDLPVAERSPEYES